MITLDDRRVRYVSPPACRSGRGQGVAEDDGAAETVGVAGEVAAEGAALVLGSAPAGAVAVMTDWPVALPFSHESQDFCQKP